MKEIRRKFTRILRDRLDEGLPFLQVVLGPRQVGKTTGLEQIVKEWPYRSLMVTADEVAAPTREWLALHWEKARRLGENGLFVIDEAQKIPEWSATVKYLYDQDRGRRSLKIVLLGSASLTLQRGLAESLAGRYEIIPATHWDLEECREAFGWGLPEFLKYGGYPAAAAIAGDLPRWQSFMRQSIIEPVLIKDILGLSAVNKPALFRQTFELSLSYPAQEVSLQKLLGQLQESGNVTTIKHYLELFEGAFLLKTLQKYSGSEVRKKASSPKLVPLSNALVHAFRSPRDVDTDPEWYGRIFEAAVGAALSRTSGKLFYWRDGRFEVDYVLELAGKLYAVEVKSSRKRSTRGLEEFIRRYPAAIPILVSTDAAARLLGAQKIDDLLTEGALVNI